MDVPMPTDAATPRASGCAPGRAARGAVIALSVLVAACTTAPTRPAASPSSLRIVCPANGDLVQCFAPASALCGRDGYDLHDLRGRRASVGDARFGALEARCRGPRAQPGQ